MKEMTITKHYHFHAAHRNQMIIDKCRNLHGHTYHITVEINIFSVNTETGVSKLFSEIDNVIEPIINQFDHSTILDSQDPLTAFLKDYSEKHQDPLKLVVIPFVTSAENLASYISRLIQHSGFSLNSFSLRETTSSTVTIKY